MTIRVGALYVAEAETANQLKVLFDEGLVPSGS
jgi:hypothetical protein